jgi:fibro-slime domain-containing protein
MRFISPPWLVAISLSLLTGACASGKIIGAGPDGTGGVNGDASTFINLDAPSTFIKLDSRAINRVGSDAPPGPNCGNGELTKDEACDDGNTVSGDGCANNCLSVEPGFSCVTPGKPCRPIARCGDGLVVFPEQCDDGNTAAGDGCSAKCKIEIGWKCDGSPSSCSHTTCGDGKIEGAEACDDGNTMPFDGCSSDCQNEPSCKTPGACTSRCGDGIVLGAEDCDDGNNTDGDGCSASCKIETGFTCSNTAPLGDRMLVPAVYRDFKFQDPNKDFQPPDPQSTGITTGAVLPDLDADGKPVFSGKTGPWLLITSKDSFSQWYRNTANVNHATTGKLTLWKNAQDAYVNRYGADGKQWYKTVTAYYCGSPTDPALDATGAAIPCTSKYGSTECDTVGAGLERASCYIANGSYQATFITEKMDGNPLFFPVDGDNFSPAADLTVAKIPPYYTVTASWPQDVDVNNVGIKHNFSFTSEVRYWFKYDASKTYQLDFVGDDDVWVFINKKLAVDLGGMHQPMPGSVTLNAAAATTFGLADGSVYEIAVFQAERRTDCSSYKLTLSGFSTAPSDCTPTCGDGILAIGEECDDGKNNGSGAYGTCSASCTLDAGFCGDGVVQPGEDCDDGGLNGTTDHCPSGCHILVPIY